MREGARAERLRDLGGKRAASRPPGETKAWKVRQARVAPHRQIGCCGATGDRLRRSASAPTRVRSCQLGYSACEHRLPPTRPRPRWRSEPWIMLVVPKAFVSSTLKDLEGLRRAIVMRLNELEVLFRGMGYSAPNRLHRSRPSYPSLRAATSSSALWVTDTARKMPTGSHSQNSSIGTRAASASTATCSLHQTTTSWSLHTRRTT